jgi:hypothetical protein
MTAIDKSELCDYVNRIIEDYVESILINLEMTVTEWNPKEHIRLFWEGPEKVVGKTTWPKGEVPCLENTTVCLFLENTIYYGLYDHFVHRIISTLAHELKHVQQIKRGMVETNGDYKRAKDGYDDYMNQAFEKEASEYAASFMHSIVGPEI